ncbi:MAG TPA: transporter [Sulfurovum sp. UBA12169]|nr:MAG TPA: transporter [Sulfurovum sp. UBA12169]
MKKLLLLALLTIVSGAQTLTVQECVEQTLANHPDIKIFMLKVAQSEESYNISRSEYLPQVSLLGEYNPQRTYVLQQGGQFSTIDDDGWSIGAMLKQKIWDFSKTASQIAASRIEQEITELSLEDAKAVMAYKIKSLYALMALQHEAINVRRQDMEAKKALYTQALGLEKQGLKTKADVARFNAAFYLAKENLKLTQASFDKSRSTMALYTDTPIQRDVKLDTRAFKHGDINLKNKYTLKNQALQNNSQLKMASKSIDKSKKIHDAAKASHYGSVDAVASHTQTDMLNRYDTSVIGITLNVPLYSGGRLSAEEQRMQIETYVAQEQLASKAIALEEELENLFLDLESYNESTKAKKAQLISAKETQKAVNARYKEGLSTYVEVLDAAAFLLEAELGLLEIKYKQYIAFSRIDYLTGK